MPHEMPYPPSTRLEETTIRRRLGIPGDAERVIIFAESSHWHPNWLLTADEYFRRFAGPNLDLALDTLAHEPRGVYSSSVCSFLACTGNGALSDTARVSASGRSRGCRSSRQDA